VLDLPRRLDLLHLDERVAAVNKPSGLVVHRSARAGDRDNCVRRLRDQLARRVWPVHRLDRGTSGVLLFALDAGAARELAAAFARRQVHKSYLAVVRGVPAESGEVDYALARAAGGARSPARTRYERLASVELPYAVGRYPTARYALVRAWPLTGREHQLRRHMAHLRHPIVGDVTHGDGRHNRFFRERFGLRRLLLHAEELRLAHPDGGELEVSAPLPEELARLWHELGWSDPSAR
jgi:tRNA pseudouridine65 synthase